MQKNQIFKLLGIEPTSDRRQIKQAYASRVRDVHPEEKPEEWTLLHDAYQAALELTEEIGPTDEKAASESTDTTGEHDRSAPGRCVMDPEYQAQGYDRQKGADLAAVRAFFRNVFEYDEDMEQEVSWGADAYERWRRFLESDLFHSLMFEDEFWWIWFQELEGKTLGAKTAVLVTEQLKKLEAELEQIGAEEETGNIRQALQMPALVPLKNKSYVKQIIWGVLGVIWIIGVIFKIVQMVL